MLANEIRRCTIIILYVRTKIVYVYIIFEHACTNMWRLERVNFCGLVQYYIKILYMCSMFIYYTLIKKKATPLNLKTMMI